MAAIDDLNASVAALQSTTEAVLVKIEELKNQPNNDAAVAAAGIAINEAVAKLTSAIA